MTVKKGVRGVWVCDPFPPTVGGAGVVYDQMAFHIDHEINILAPAFGLSGVFDPPDSSSDSAYDVVRLRLRPDVCSAEKTGLPARLRQFWRHRQFEKQLFLQIADHSKGADYILVGGVGSLGWLVPALRAKTGKPVIVYIHGEEVSHKPRNLWQKRRLLRALHSADRLVAVSGNTREMLTKKSVRRERVCVIHNGVAPLPASCKSRADVHTELGIERGGVMVLAVGRLVARKGFDTLVKIWPTIEDTLGRAHLVIVGDGPLRDSLVEEAAGHNIHLTGEKTGAELADLYRAADVFALPNRLLENGDTEGFGLVFLEAALAGLPAIGGRDGGVPDAVCHQKTGLLVNGRRAPDVRDGLMTLMANADLRETMGKAARLHAESQTWASKAALFEDLVQDMLEERKGG